jgi:uncharacterized membrane protein YgaE (UPF0421/DUF939 family)
VNNLYSYFLIVLGVAIIILSVYVLFTSNNPFIPICSFITGMALIKTSINKIRLKKENEVNNK